MRHLQLEARTRSAQGEHTNVDFQQLERRIIILTSMCNSVFARQADFANLSDAKIQYAEVLKSKQKTADDANDWIKFEVVK